MTRGLVDQLVNALLYEGYILYPYRPSVKNRQRWTFGGLFPQSSTLARSGSEPSSMQTECLVRGDSSASLQVTVRFLHLIDRQIGKLDDPTEFFSADATYRPVESLACGDRTYQSWQEARERSVTVQFTSLHELADGQFRQAFSFPASQEREPIRDEELRIVAVMAREQALIEGAVEMAASQLSSELSKITLRVVNKTPITETGTLTRDQVLVHGLVSTHAVLEVTGGEFVSQTDPEPDAKAAAAASRNVGCWPVLVGEEGDRHTMLASPIILYDYPQIAPESPGDLFDATEIDEILSLRILTLTDEERREASAVDPRARSLLERTESLARSQLMNLHGTVRGLRPVKESDA